MEKDSNSIYASRLVWVFVIPVEKIRSLLELQFKFSPT